MRPTTVLYCLLAISSTATAELWRRTDGNKPALVEGGNQPPVEPKPPVVGGGVFVSESVSDYVVTLKTTFYFTSTITGANGETSLVTGASTGALSAEPTASTALITTPAPTPVETRPLKSPVPAQRTTTITLDCKGQHSTAKCIPTTKTLTVKMTTTVTHITSITSKKDPTCAECTPIPVTSIYAQIIPCDDVTITASETETKDITQTQTVEESTTKPTPTQPTPKTDTPTNTPSPSSLASSASSSSPSSEVKPKPTKPTPPNPNPPKSEPSKPTNSEPTKSDKSTGPDSTAAEPSTHAPPPAPTHPKPTKETRSTPASSTPTPPIIEPTIAPPPAPTHPKPTKETPSAPASSTTTPPIEPTNAPPEVTTPIKTRTYITTDICPTESPKSYLLTRDFTWQKTATCTASVPTIVTEGDKKHAILTYDFALTATISQTIDKDHDYTIGRDSKPTKNTGSRTVAYITIDRTIYELPTGKTAVFFAATETPTSTQIATMMAAKNLKRENNPPPKRVLVRWARNGAVAV